jgi:hypothetical protein
MAELAIGGVSFFFQVFAGCIQGTYVQSDIMEASCFFEMAHFVQPSNW